MPEKKLRILMSNLNFPWSIAGRQYDDGNCLPWIRTAWNKCSSLEYIASKFNRHCKVNQFRGMGIALSLLLWHNGKETFFPYNGSKNKYTRKIFRLIFSRKMENVQKVTHSKIAHHCSRSSKMSIHKSTRLLIWDVPSSRRKSSSCSMGEKFLD